MFEAINCHKVEIENLYKSGLSIRKVASTLNLKSGTVGAYVKHIGLSRTDFKGSKNPFYGKRHSEEFKQKHSKLMTGKVSVNKGQCKYGEGIIPRLLIKVWENNAVRRELQFLVTPEQLDQLWLRQNGCCALTGIVMSNDYYSTKNTKVSLDRIDSSLDYTTDNIQLVVGIINIMKNSLENDEFIAMCKKVTNHVNG